MVTDADMVDWYNSNWNKPRRFSKRQWPVTIDTSLSTGDYVFVSETGEEIMQNYFKTFQVDPGGFDFYKYWPVEPFILFAFLPKCMRGDEDEPRPLTLRMLAESAKAGRWLYD